MLPSIRLLLVYTLTQNVVSGFGWFTPAKPRNTSPKAVSAPPRRVRVASARSTTQVYTFTENILEKSAKVPSPMRGRTSSLSKVSTLEKPATPNKRIVVVLPPKTSVLTKTAGPAAGQVSPQAAAAAPDAKTYEHMYWYDPRIHNWGNTGLRGLFHAVCAPLATYMIDRLSYGGVDVRGKIHKTIPEDASVLDLCCGTGFSSASGATGIDTSSEMISVAKLRRPDCNFACGNAETYGETNSFDVVTMMFATHEMPAIGRRRVLRNAMRVAKKSVIVADIDPDFFETLRAKPMEGATFLSGEPYVLDYLKQMDSDVNACAPLRLSAPTWKVTREAILPKHVVVWRLDKVY